MDGPANTPNEGVHGVSSPVAGRPATVVSAAFGRATNFLDYGHPNFSSPLQMSTLRAAYKDSMGTSVLVPAHRFDEATVVYAGAWSRLRAPADERMAAEFTTGAITGLVGDRPTPTPDPATFEAAAPFVGGCAVVADSGYNLHHFLWEHLPAIHLYRDLISDAGRLLLGMIDSPTPFAPRLVRLLGIDVPVTPMPLHSIVPIRDTTVVGTFPFRVYPLDLVRQISREIAGAVPESQSRSTGPSVVFLGRGDRERNRRRLSNEDAVLTEIEHAAPDVAVLRPALTPIDDTIAALRDCRVLIGPTGGAMAHHLWADRLEHVIEIVPVEYPGATETEEAALMLGFAYHRVDATMAVTGRRWVDADSLCDLTGLSRTLRSAGVATG